MRQQIVCWAFLLLSACSVAPHAPAGNGEGGPIPVEAVPVPIVQPSYQTVPPPPPPAVPPEGFESAGPEEGPPVPAHGSPGHSDHGAATSSIRAPATDTAAEPEPAPAEGPPAGRVEQGLGAFTTPPPMQVGRWYNVQFVVAPSAQALKEEAAGKATEEAKDIYTAPKMRVTLASEQDFKAVAKTPEVQSLGLDKSATWQWDVSPQSGGELELTARIEPLDADGNAMDSYTKYVTVHAKAGAYESFMAGTHNATSAGDALTRLFKSWRETLLALAAMIAAVFVVWRVVKNRGAGSASTGSDQQ